MIPPDAAADPDRRLAAAAGDRLLAGAVGLNLVGAQDRLDRILRLLRHRLDQDRLLPVPFEAARGTPDSLRDAVARAHAGRASADTALVLIVPDAGRLSAGLLRELDMAADAAARFGGLKLVLASAGPVRALLRDTGLHALQAALGTELGVTPLDARPGPAVLRAGAATSPSRRPPPRRSGRIMLGAAVLAGFLVLLALLLLTLRPPPPVRPAVPPPPPPVAAAPQARQPPPQQQTAPAPDTGLTPLPPAARSPGASLLLVAQPGDTLPVLYARIYAGLQPPPFALVQTLNPVVRPGTRLVFPPPPGGWPATP